MSENGKFEPALPYLACMQHDLVRMSRNITLVSVSPIVGYGVCKYRRAIDIVESGCHYRSNHRVLLIAALDVKGLINIQRSAIGAIDIQAKPAYSSIGSCSSCPKS